MIHLSQEQASRYVARTLSGRERLAISEHLASCPACRHWLARSRTLQLRSWKVLPELTGKYPEQAVPVRHPAGETRALASRFTRWFAERWFTAGMGRDSNSAIRKWLEFVRVGRGLLKPGPALAAGALFAGILSLAIALVGIRTGPKDWLPDGSVRNRFVALEDHGQLIHVGFDGTLTGLAHAPETPEAESVRRVLAALLHERSLAMSPDLQRLRAGSETAVKSTAADASFEAFGPTQTFVSSACPEFRWPAVTGASEYVLHIIDDEADREVYRSGMIAATGGVNAPVRWTLPDQQRLSAGVVYRWHVTAMTESRSINLPAVGDRSNRFAVMPATQAFVLRKAKESWGPSALAGAALDLDAGLLDDAEAGFRKLRDNPSQTPQGRELLDRLIASVERFRTDLP